MNARNTITLIHILLCVSVASPKQKQNGKNTMISDTSAPAYIIGMRKTVFPDNGLRDSEHEMVEDRFWHGRADFPALKREMVRRRGAQYLSNMLELIINRIGKLKCSKVQW